MGGAEHLPLEAVQHKDCKSNFPMFQLACKSKAAISRLNCCHCQCFCAWFTPPLSHHRCYQMTSLSTDGTRADADSFIILLTNSSVNDHVAPMLTARVDVKHSDPGMKPEFNFSRLCAPSRYTFIKKRKLAILDTSSVNAQTANGVPFERGLFLFGGF